MITLQKPVPFTGPYCRRVRWTEIALSAIAHVAIGLLLFYAILGMAGAWDEVQACWQCVERMGK